jgi:hypothetical protein
VKIRLALGAVLTAAALAPLAPASANTGCTFFPGQGITDPDVVATACNAGWTAVNRVLCGKNPSCME